MFRPFLYPQLGVSISFPPFSLSLSLSHRRQSIYLPFPHSLSCPHPPSSLHVAYLSSLCGCLFLFTYCPSRPLLLASIWSVPSTLSSTLLPPHSRLPFPIRIRPPSLLPLYLSLYSPFYLPFRPSSLAVSLSPVFYLFRSPSRAKPGVGGGRKKAKQKQI